MRITVSHTKSKQEVMRSVDRSFEELFRSVSSVPIQFVEERRNWQGSTLTFSNQAKLMSTNNAKIMWLDNMNSFEVVD